MDRSDSDSIYNYKNILGHFKRIYDLCLFRQFETAIHSVKPTAYNYGPLGHIKIAHSVWSSVVKLGDTVIDATCGNGHDSLYMAQLSLTESTGRLFCMDIQTRAIENTRARLLQSSQFIDRVSFVCGNHAIFPAEISPSSVSLVVYNLGYLPSPDGGSEDILKTNMSTTLQSITSACLLLKEGGLLSVTAYPAHEGGQAELLAVQQLLSSFDQEVWRVHAHAPLNRPLSPTLFLAFKIEKFGYYKNKNKKKV